MRKRRDSLRTRITDEYVDALEQPTDFLATFDDVCDSYAGSFGLCQALLLVLTIVLSVENLQPEVIVNILDPPFSNEFFDFQCVPEYDHLKDVNYRLNVLRHVLANVPSKCDAYQLRRMGNPGLKNSARHAKMKVEQLKFFLDQNLTVDKDFAPIRRCREVINSKYKTFHGKMQGNMGQYASLLEEFQMHCVFTGWGRIFYHPITYYTTSQILTCAVISFLADKYGRHKVAKNLAFFAVVLIFAPLSQSYVGFVWVNIANGFRHYEVFILTMIALMETTSWQYRGMLTSLCFLGEVMIFPVDAFSKQSVQNWRVYTACTCAVPLLTYLLFIWVAFESPRWQLAHGLVTQATKTLTHVAHINKHQSKSKNLYVDLDAVAETEFTEENQNGFWAYLKLQKRSFLILLFTRFTLRLSRIEWHDTYEYARSHKNWEQSAAYAVSTIAFSLLCFLIYKKGNYNKPMVALSITACLWNVWRVVYILLMMNSASTILHFEIYDLVVKVLEPFVCNLVGSCIMIGHALQAFHTVPTVYRVRWCLLVLTISYTASSPFIVALHFLPLNWKRLVQCSVLVALFMATAVAQKYMPYISPFVSEEELLLGANLRTEYEEEAKRKVLLRERSRSSVHRK